MVLKDIKTHADRQGSCSRGRVAPDPYMDGYEAQEAGLTRTVNPYCSKDFRELWDAGWVEAASVIGKAAHDGRSGNLPSGM